MQLVFVLRPDDFPVDIDGNIRRGEQIRQELANFGEFFRGNPVEFCDQDRAPRRRHQHGRVYDGVRFPDQRLVVEVFDHSDDRARSLEQEYRFPDRAVGPLHFFDQLFVDNDFIAGRVGAEITARCHPDLHCRDKVGVDAVGENMHAPAGGLFRDVVSRTFISGQTRRETHNLYGRELPELVFQHVGLCRVESRKPDKDEILVTEPRIFMKHQATIASNVIIRAAHPNWMKSRNCFHSRLFSA